MNLIEKIQSIMDERNLTKADVSKGADIPYTTFDGIFKKGYEKMKLPTLKKLADYFGVSMEYLINDKIADKNYGKGENINIKLQEAKITTNYLGIKKGEYFYIKVIDNSMTGSRICKGDLALIRKQTEIENGDIALVRYSSSEAILRRVNKIDNKIILYADNSKYEPIITNINETEIIGEVVKIEFNPNEK